MTKIDPAPQDVAKYLKEANWVTTEELVAQYGQPKVLDDDDIHVLQKYGLGMHIFCTICNEQSPTSFDCGEPGYHFVNVMERFVFPNPLPAELYVEEVNYGVLYGE